MTSRQTLITWEESDSGVVKSMAFTHRGECDVAGYSCSAGAAYGPNWEPEYERDGVGKKPFERVRDRANFQLILSEQFKARTAALNA